MKRTTFRLLVVSSLLLTLATARTRPRYGGALRVEISGTGWEEDGVVRRLVSETLTKIDDDGKVQPELALRWESQNGGRRWQFWIRPGVKFHDGSILNSATVAQALSASGCKNCPWRSARAAADSVVLDSDSPMPLLPSQLAMTRFGITKTGDNGATIGTGPFRLESSSAGVTTLRTFDEYWRTAPYLDSIEIAGGRSLRDQWLDLSLGRADVVEVPAEHIRKAQQERLHVSSTRDLELVALVVQSANAALQDRRVRQAISESIDRASLLNVIFQRQGEITGTLLPNWLTGFGPLFPGTRDIDKARELRGQWIAPISPLTIGYDPADATSQLVAERIALNTREIGLTVQAVARTQNADMYVRRVRLPSLEPSVALEGIASALAAGAATPDDTTPESVLKREREMIVDYRAIPLLYAPDGYAWSERIHDLRLNMLGVPQFMDAWTEARR